MKSLIFCLGLLSNKFRAELDSLLEDRTKWVDQKNPDGTDALNYDGSPRTYATYYRDDRIKELSRDIQMLDFVMSDIRTMFESRYPLLPARSEVEDANNWNNQYRKSRDMK